MFLSIINHIDFSYMFSLFFDSNYETVWFKETIQAKISKQQKIFRKLFSPLTFTLTSSKTTHSLNISGHKGIKP